jgi:hypothetical protein
VFSIVPAPVVNSGIVGVREDFMQTVHDVKQIFGHLLHK